MRVSRSGLFAVLALSLLRPGLAAAQKLDNDDKKFLNDVHPLMLADEESTYKKLKDKADRLEFQKIFWARRDPDLATPQNEVQEQFLKDRAEADLKYRVAGVAGSLTDCGRTYILLGKPDEVQGDATMNPGVRAPETWTYKNRPEKKFAGGKISFDAECRGVAGLDAQLDRIAAAQITNVNIDYRTGKDGHIVKLVDQLPKETFASALFREPRQDFALAANPSFLKTADGATALLGAAQGDASALVGADAKVVNVTVAASAVTAEGKEVGRATVTTDAPVAGGKFLVTYKMGVKPGKYTLRTAVYATASKKGSVVSSPIDVPDFAQMETVDGVSVPVLSGTVVVVKEMQNVPENTPEDPADPLGAFRLTSVRMIPVMPSALHKTDTVSFFFQLYDFRVDPATKKARGTARLRLMKEGRGQLTSSEETAIDTPMYGTEIGPVPLANLEPGKYVARLEAADKIAQKTITRDAPFEILP